MTEALVRQTFREELERIRAEARDGLHGPPDPALEADFVQAAQEAQDIFTRPELSEFLTLESEPV